MQFDEFVKRAVTALIGAQQDDGSWFGDIPATCAAIEVLAEHGYGYQGICCQSLLYRLSHGRKSVPRPGGIWLSYEDALPLHRGIGSIGYLINTSQGKFVPRPDGILRGYEYVLPLYGGIGSSADIFNPWISAKIARILSVVTDFDYVLGYKRIFLPLWKYRSSEPWLIAQIGLARLHLDRPFDRTPSDKSDVVKYVEQLKKLFADSHWESETVTPEETTGIVNSFLFHTCTIFLLKKLSKKQWLENCADACALWLINSQQDTGGWSDSPHVTSHCLRAVSALIESKCTKQLTVDALKRSAKSAIEYLFSPGILPTWDRLSSYQSIEILLTLLQISKSEIIEHTFFDSLQVESEALTPNVFISYGGCDKEFALRLAKDLEKNGINVWIAEWDLDYGDDIVQEIERGLNETKKFIILLSPEALNRAWVRQELSSAFHMALSESGKLVVPVLFKTCDVPLFLATKRRIDFRKKEAYEKSLLELVRRLKGKKKQRE
jgi:hypothetical protein